VQTRAAPSVAGLTGPTGPSVRSNATSDRETELASVSHRLRVLETAPTWRTAYDRTVPVSAYNQSSDLLTLCLSFCVSHRCRPDQLQLHKKSIIFVTLAVKPVCVCKPHVSVKQPFSAVRGTNIIQPSGIGNLNTPPCVSRLQNMDTLV